MTDGNAFEKSVARAAGSGCADAVEELFRRYNAFVCAVIRPYAPTQADAEDWAQDTWCATLRGLPTYRGTAKVRTWLYKVAVNQARQGLRVCKRQERTQSCAVCPGAREPDLRDAVDSPLMLCVAALPAGQRQVFRMRVLDELPYAVVAARLGITSSTARTQYRKARLKLQRALAAGAVSQVHSRWRSPRYVCVHVPAETWVWGDKAYAAVSGSSKCTIS